MRTLRNGSHGPTGIAPQFLRQGNSRLAKPIASERATTKWSRVWQCTSANAGMRPVIQLVLAVCHLIQLPKCLVQVYFFESPTSDRHFLKDPQLIHFRPHLTLGKALGKLWRDAYSSAISLPALRCTQIWIPFEFSAQRIIFCRSAHAMPTP